MAGFKTLQKNVNKYCLSADPNIFGSADVTQQHEYRNAFFFFIVAGRVSIYGVSQI